VLGVDADGSVLATSAEHGLFSLQSRAVVLAMGCRERTRGAIAIPGTRPAGVLTAGTAQYLVNRQGYLPGRRFAILGSGDIGMIMARRLVWEGAEVVGVYELMPYISGLRRNYVQCLLDYEVPLHLNHTVTEVRGVRRVTAVTVAPVGANREPDRVKEEVVLADTLLLSVGLIPENELTRRLGVAMDPATGGPRVDNRMETSMPGVFAAGNVVHVYDLVDDVSLAAEVAGRSAARRALNLDTMTPHRVPVDVGRNLRAVVPQWLRRSDAHLGFELHLRARVPIEAPSTLTLTSPAVGGGDRVLVRAHLKYARPGEMLSLRVPGSVGGELGDHLRVDLTPVHGAA
jgi:thioredoxin reductase